MLACAIVVLDNIVPPVVLPFGDDLHRRSAGGIPGHCLLEHGHVAVLAVGEFHGNYGCASPDVSKPDAGGRTEIAFEALGREVRKETPCLLSVGRQLETNCCPISPSNVEGVVVQNPGQLVWIKQDLIQRLFQVCVESLPSKCYGLVGGQDLYHPWSLYPCSSNLRNSPEWRQVFESFGDFYKDPDRGFVITPDEFQEVMSTMADRGESFIGVFHSHRCRPAAPSTVDMELSFGRNVFSYIVSVVHLEKPELRIYRLHEAHYEEIPFQPV